MEWHGGAVELASAVVGQDDAVGTVVEDATGIVDGLKSLGDEVAGPHVADPVDVLEGEGGVEHAVDEFGDGA